MSSKHPYDPECGCDRCCREAARREAQRGANALLEDRYRPGRRGRVARECWDAYESGRPMSHDDY